MTAMRLPLYAGAAALAVAAGLGFFAARITTPPPAASEAPKAEAQAGGAALTMAEDVIRSAGVAVEAVSTGGLNGEILAPATVVAAPDGQAVLTAHAAGAVSRIYKRLGDPVKAGEAVALVESREAAGIAADRSVATAKAALARQALAREQRLFEQKVSPRQDVEQAEAEAAAATAEARRADAAASAAHVSADGRGVVVTSPITGRITSATASLGSFVASETELFRVADPGRVQLEASVSAADARRIAPGDPATVEAAGGRSLAAAVRAVSPSLNAETRSAGVVLTLDAADAVTPGQSVRIRIRIRPKVGAAGTGVVIPDEAVQSVGGHDSVFVRTPDGFRLQSVTLGERRSGRAEVAEGLKAGEIIATRNSFLLKAELGKGEAGEE